jgi:RNA polymerase sigma-70 factor, ECF subfamily
MSKLGGAFQAIREVDDASAALLDAELADGVARARAPWPGFNLSDEQFVAELAERMAASNDVVASLRSTHVEDLFLAVACAAGDSTALARFEELFVPDLRRRLAQMGFSDGVVSDTLQELRHELFVPGPGQRAKVKNYSAHGALQGWVRAVGVRTGLRIARKLGQATELDESFAASVDDPELAYLKEIYRGPFEESFREALTAMGAPERLLLKQRFRHGLHLDQLASLYGVHSSTMSRRVAEARERLVAATRDGMMRRLKVSRAEVSSILRLIQSEIDITLSQVPEPGVKVPTGDV